MASRLKHFYERTRCPGTYGKLKGPERVQQLKLEADALAELKAAAPYKFKEIKGGTSTAEFTEVKEVSNMTMTSMIKGDDLASKEEVKTSP